MNFLTGKKSAMVQVLWTASKRAGGAPKKFSPRGEVASPPPPVHPTATRICKFGDGEKAT